MLTARDQASAVIQKVSGDLDKMGTSASGLGGKLQAAGGAIATAFTGAAIAGVAGLAAGLGAAVKSGADFEKAMSGIKAVSGATAEEMVALQDAALQLGKDTSFSAKEAATGIEELIKAGVSITDVIGGGAKASLDLAAAGAVGVGEAAEIAANAMNVFGIQGKDMGHVADVIAGAANASAISVTDYKFSLAAAGAVAATVGVGFEDLSTAIALMGNAGIKGSDAGTSLKTMLMNLSPTTKAQTKAFRDLGIVTADGSNLFFDAAGNAKSLAEIAGVLQTATKGLTKEQKLMALETMFGSDAIRAAAVLAEAGAEGFKELAGEISKVTAAQVASERLNNLSGALEQLKGSLETAAISVGLKLMPGLTKLTQWATTQVNAAIPSLEAFAESLVRTLEVASNGIQTLFEIFSGQDMQVELAEVLGTFGLAEFAPAVHAIVTQVGDAWRTLGEIFTSGWEPSETVDPFVNAVGQIGIVLRDVVMPAVQEVSAFIIAQFGTVISWFQTNWPLIIQTNQTVVDQMKIAWGEGGGGLANVVQVSWAAIKTVIETELAAILGLTKAQLQILNGDWKGAWETIVATNQTFGQAILDILYMIFGGTVQAIGRWASDTVNAFSQWASDTASAAAEGGRGILDSVTSWISGTVSAIGQWAADTRSSIQAGIDAAVQSIRSGWQGIVDFVAGVMASIQQTILAVWDALPDDIQADLALIASALTGRGQEWVASMVTAGQGILDAISAWVGETVDSVQQWATEMGASILTSGVEWVASMVATGEGILGAIATWIDETVKAVTTWATDTFLKPIQDLVETAGTEADSVGSELYTSITTWLDDVIEEVRDWATEFIRPLTGLIASVRTIAESVGQAISNGIASGISSATQAIKNAALRAARSALDAAKDFLGIHSPSAVFRDQVGRMMPAGIIEGIEAMQRSVNAAAAGMVSPLPALASASAAPISAAQLAAPTPFGAGGGGSVTNVYISVGNLLASREDLADAVVVGMREAERQGRTKVTVIG